MTSCDRIVPLFSLHLEGESSPAEDAQVRTHLVECAECRQEFADLKATLVLVRELPTIAAPEGFEAQVLLRLNEARAVSNQSAELSAWERDDAAAVGAPTVIVIEDRWWRHWIPRFAAAAAAAAVVSLALIGGQRMLRPGAWVGADQASGPAIVSSPGAQDFADGALPDGSSDSRIGAESVSGGGRPVSSSAGLVSAGSSRGVAGPQGLVSLGDRSPGDSRRFDDLRSLFPDLPAELIPAIPLNGETYASDRLVARPGSVAGGTQVLAPVEYRSVEPVYIYR